MPDFSLERDYLGYVAGLDEAGCGPWAGPVVAAAAMFLDQNLPPEVMNLFDDSKKLSAKKRAQANQVLRALPPHQFVYALGLASADEIDTLNIRKAAMLALTRAFDGLRVPPTACLVDGTYPAFLPVPQRSVIKGDSLSYSIAAASILVKVERDHLMEQLGETYPGYGFEKHAGYGTKAHQEALQKLGPCPEHRKSFAPIAALMNAA